MRFRWLWFHTGGCTWPIRQFRKILFAATGCNAASASFSRGVQGMLRIPTCSLAEQPPVQRADVNCHGRATCTRVTAKESHTSVYRAGACGCVRPADYTTHRPGMVSSLAWWGQGTRRFRGQRYGRPLYCCCLILVSWLRMCFVRFLQIYVTVISSQRQRQHAH